MKTNQKSAAGQNKNVSSKSNENPDQQKKKDTTDKKKGVMSEMNDKSDKKK